MVLHTQFEHGPLASVRQVSDEVERDVQLFDRLLVGDVVGAPRRRLEGVLDGDGDRCGRHRTRPVRGDLEHVGTCRVAVVDVERLGDEVVRASALRRSHVLVDGLVDEAVGEAVAARPTGVVDDDACREGRFEVIEEVAPSMSRLAARTARSKAWRAWRRTSKDGSSVCRKRTSNLMIGLSAKEAFDQMM